MHNGLFRTALASTLFAMTYGTGFLAAQEAPHSSMELSVTVVPLLEPLFILWKNAYQRRHPSSMIEYLSTENTLAVQALISGKSPISPATKDMTSDEISTFTSRWGYPPTRMAIAMDAVVILVNHNNPVREIKMEQLDAMYTTTRFQGAAENVDTWGDLGLTDPNWVRRPIERWGHPVGTGTRTFWNQMVELGGTEKFNIKRGSDVSYMVENIMANQAAIGYGSIAQVCSSMKSVPLVANGSKHAVEATQKTVADGSYPLARFLYVYINKAPKKPLNPELRDFLAFIISKEGQSLVPSSGFIALSADMAALSKNRLEN